MNRDVKILVDAVARINGMIPEYSIFLQPIDNKLAIVVKRNPEGAVEEEPLVDTYREYSGPIPGYAPKLERTDNVEAISMDGDTINSMTVIKS